MIPIASPSLRSRRLNEDWATTATTAMQEVTPDLPSGPTQIDLAEKQSCGNVVIIVQASREGGQKDIGVKCYWYASAATQLPAAKGLLFFEATEDQVGLPGDAVATMSPWPALWRHPEPEPRVWRGVFSPPYHREVLFSQQVEVRTADLPRWQPRITIDRRTVAREDD